MIFRRKRALLTPLQAVVLVAAVYSRKIPYASTVSTDTVHAAGEADSVSDKNLSNWRSLPSDQDLLNDQRHPLETSVDPGFGCVGGRCGSGSDVDDSGRRRESRDSVVETGDGDGEGGALSMQRELRSEWSRRIPNTSFLDLARSRFEEREGRPATKADEDWVFPHLQLVRVPKAASTAVSMIARSLAGCTPAGPCCAWPGDPVGTCPAKNLMCENVTGCAGHYMNPKKRAMMRDPKTFSMSTIRDVTDRMVSAFFYSAPHSPACARRDIVNYDRCFRNMANSPRFQNVAGRMLVGYYAYDGQRKICLRPGKGCSGNLNMVIRSACDLNFIAVSEAWNTSMLLLFEIIPWMGPSKTYFPDSSGGRGDTGGKGKSQPHLEIYQKLPGPTTEQLAAMYQRSAKHHGTRRMDSEFDAAAGHFDGAARQHGGRGLADGGVTGDVTRHNTGKRHEEGIAHITTPQLMEIAKRRNPVDIQLHEFVTAMFCRRLREVGLVNEPLVVEELMSNQALAEMCYDESRIRDTLARFSLRNSRGETCRLFQPLPRDDFL